jgi:hypothetical protein
VENTTHRWHIGSSWGGWVKDGWSQRWSPPVRPSAVALRGHFRPALNLRHLLIHRLQHFSRLRQVQSHGKEKGERGKRGED